MNNSKQRGRRTFIAALGATMAGVALPSWATYQPDQFRIGYQKAASTLVLLKAHGALEKRLAPLGVKVSWNEFPAGPQLLEGLNVGAIDFSYVERRRRYLPRLRARILSIPRTSFPRRTPKG